ncbi:MAG: chitobiase/beta-hexosaminidase C-terminal domain-containing protein [Prevotella sp.]|nr:chitobiase/beta-hexosaminidase C-terminal domain-containing protein [Prevotella sp.]
MKKLFTLQIILSMALIAGAQGYRKWTFTNWSATTVNNLAVEAQNGVTGGAWSDTEKANGDNPQPGKCYWAYSADLVNADGALLANGAPIAETEGLVFNSAYVSRRSLAIAVDYPSTSLGDYAGPQYLWLGGGNAKSASARIWCFAIPKVRVGQKITFELESHKPAESRGVALFVNDCTNDEFQIGEQFKPKEKETYTWEEGWTLPEGATVNDDGTVDIYVYNTNGCHIYSIEVGDNTQKASVGYLYEGDPMAELALPNLSQSERYTLETIDANSALTMEQLTAYDAVVISSTVANAEAISKLKGIQPFVPVLNLNPALYEAWGYGTVDDSGTQFAVVKNPASSLFTGLELIPDDTAEEEGVMVLPLTDMVTFPCLTLKGLFADDAIVAVPYERPEAVAIHQHNMGHNGYIFIPYTQQTLAEAVSPALLVNAANALINTKAKVTQAAAPTISLSYKDLVTTVTLNSTVPAAEIFYTLDGSTPTEASTLYTEPFSISTEGVTVKAVARGDGYLMSDPVEKLIDLRRQAAMPTIATTQEDGVTIVTLTAPSEEATVYYNYSGSTEQKKSSPYTEPISVTQLGRTIYAFTEAEGFVNSELASLAVPISNPKVRIDVLAHMDANSTDYNGGSTSTAYFFSWGKDKAAYPYFNVEEFTLEDVEDPETGEVREVKTYTALNAEEEKDFENGWMVRSRGQLVTWENLTSGTNYGDKTGYNFATVDEENPYFPATKAIINLADKNTTPSDGQSFPYNAYIVSTQKFKGPFDMVANIGSIVKPENEATHTVVLQYSVDGNQWDSQWETLGDTITIVSRQRLTTNVVRSYDGTDEVYVRAYLCGNNSKVGFYDIYIANEGEQSKQLLADYLSGISQLNVTKAAEGIYTIGGIRRSQMQRGLNIVVDGNGNVRKVLVK